MPQSARARRDVPAASIPVPSRKRRKIERVSDGERSDGTPSSNHALGAPLRRPTAHHSSSGESAGWWFDNVNKNVQHDAGPPSLYDQDPPFYMASQAPYSQLPHSGASSRAFGGVLPVVIDTEKEELRDVIDDLTIENKKLKQKLHSQKSRSSLAEGGKVDGKLFELRVHGMPAEKKRELELLLKNFAGTLGKDLIPSRSAASRSSDQLASNSPFSMGAAGAQNATHVHTDSGYGSYSNSGNGGHAMPVRSVSKDRTIKSYLHDIPDVLLPRPSYRMSDKDKMAVVVRRLEQLFTGKQATPGEHRQPMQQQEVSRSAANAEREEKNPCNRRGWSEGSREAHILPLDSNISLDVSEAPSPAKSLHSKMNTGKSNSPSMDGSGTEQSRIDLPDQRPTRPLDLDIGRAQVAQDNIEYIRHLYLSDPGLDQSGAKKPQWIYLNLLVSMAQLHTLNVTPDFIRRAIRKHSTRLELSKDLQSIRWKGGADTPEFSKETEQAMEDTSNSGTDPAHAQSMGFKHTQNGGNSSGHISFAPSDDQTSRVESSSAANQKSSNLASPHASNEKVPIRGKTAYPFDYKPLFYKRRGNSSSDDSASSAATDSIDPVDLSREGEGMLTFFNNPYFCSDFSADKHPTNYVSDELSGLAVFPAAVLGINDSDGEQQESAYREHDACYFAPQFATKFSEPKNRRPFAFEAEPINAAGEYETQPSEMEASGLGMTMPADNFAIDVKVARESAQGRHVVKHKNRLQGGKAARFEYHVESAHHIELQPSRLPSPSYLFFTSSSSSNLDGMEDQESDASDASSSANEVSPAPLALMRHFSMDTSGSYGNDENMDDDDCSIDMLAAARADDPERLAAQEHEYLLHHPGAAMTVTASLAATVGTESVPEDSGNGVG